jgi:protein-S-isoprenylcysteine O-methyltransferase Ste14
MVRHTRRFREGRDPTGLLPRMRTELLDRGSLRPRVAAQVYVAYGVHAGLTAAAARRRQLPLPVPEPAAQVTGTLLAGAGGALCLAGMRRFSRASHVSGTAVEGLITAVPGLHPRPDRSGPGPPRRTRTTPHRRAGVTYRRWIPTEEQHLQRLFGARYTHYRSSTHRWFGRPQVRTDARAWTR